MRSPSSNDDFVFQEYLVVFFDLIGQREAMRRITGIPITEMEQDEFIGVGRGRTKPMG